jgi:nucleotide-binding universal stress UspA family protein
MDMKKVLIAIDYDPTAQKVAEEGFELAKTMGAGVVLLHVIADPVYYSSTDYSPIMGFTGYLDSGLLQLSTIAELKKASMHFLEKTRSHLGNPDIQLIVEDGDFAKTILKTAKHLKVSTIVMGSHSRKWLENIVMGSVTNDVLHHSTIPLFIVPTKHRK